MLSKPDEWVEQWHLLRPDADFRKVSEEDNKKPAENEGFTDSYEALRSSPENNSVDSDQPYERERSASLGGTPGPRSVLVYPGSVKPASDKTSDDHVIPPTIDKPDTSPQKMDDKKDLSKLDDEELNALTKENTKLNRGNGISSTPVKKVWWIM